MDHVTASDCGVARNLWCQNRVTGQKRLGTTGLSWPQVSQETSQSTVRFMSTKWFNYLLSNFTLTGWDSWDKTMSCQVKQHVQKLLRPSFHSLPPWSSSHSGWKLRSSADRRRRCYINKLWALQSVLEKQQSHKISWLIVIVAKKKGQNKCSRTRANAFVLPAIMHGD